MKLTCSTGVPLISNLLTGLIDNPVITLIVFAGKLRDGRLVKIAEDLS